MRSGKLAKRVFITKMTGTPGGPEKKKLVQTERVGGVARIGSAAGGTSCATRYFPLQITVENLQRARTAWPPAVSGGVHRGDRDVEGGNSPI